MESSVEHIERAEIVEVAGAMGGLDHPALLARLRELEGRRRELEAETAVVLAELDDRQAHRVDGHASMWGLLRVVCGWSDRECRERMQLARLLARFPDAAETLHTAQASVANVVEIARAHANPRCGDEIDAVIGTLLTAATRLEHDDLKAAVRVWERTADVDGAHRDTETTHANRNAHVVVWDGVGHAAAQWGEIDGLANQEVFDRFVQTEWQADWDETVARHGDAACEALMPRTDAQRRADAMTRVFAAAASTAPGSRLAEPVVAVHVDWHTFSDVMTELELFPDRAVDPFEPRSALVTDRRCETGSGHPVDPVTAVQLAIEHHVRIVVHDDEGIPIRWGRTRRLSPVRPVPRCCRCHPDVPIPDAGSGRHAATSTTPSTTGTVARPTPPTATRAAVATTASRTTATPLGATTAASGTRTAPTAPRSAERGSRRASRVEQPPSRPRAASRDIL